MRKDFNRDLERLLRKLEQLMYNSYLMGLNIPQVRNSLAGDKPFWFSHNFTANRAMERVVSDFSKQTNHLLTSGIDRSWRLGEENAFDKIQLMVSGKARENKALDQMRAEATQQQRNEGSAASAKRFINEKRGGATLSDRVWKLGDGMKKEIETLVQNGMKEGKSAQDLSKMLKQHLKEPDRLYRRVRNKDTGELELSEAAKKYKPGRGVYRSAHKNAMRLARTEIAAAYRRAAWESFQNDPTVIGIRIALSNNHTCINPKTGKAEPFTDICDDLAGTYPKTFLWTGWHPQCRCELYPILISGKELRKIADAKAKKKKYTPKQITEVPKALNQWVDRNKERAKGWKNMPYWAKDNKQHIKTNFKVNTYTKDEYTFTRARNVQMAMNRAIQELKELYPKLENTELAAIHHYTREGGNYRQLNKQLAKGDLTEFNRASTSLIKRGLEQMPAYKGTVYRGSIMKQADYKRLYEGKNEVKHEIFTSTSQNATIASNFATYRAIKKNEVSVMFRIESKKGRDISDISEFSGNFTHDNQREVLFTSGTRFKVVSQQKDLFGNITINLSEL